MQIDIQWAIIILPVAVALFFIFGYTICVYRKKPNEMWSWLHSLMSTFVSVLIGVSIAILLFFFQSKYADQQERGRYQSLLRSELAYSYRELCGKADPLTFNFNDASYSFHNVALLQPVVLEDAGRSGLFDANQASNMLGTARDMRLRNKTIDIVLSLLSQGNLDPACESIIKLTLSNFDRATSDILQDMNILDEELNLNFPRTQEAKHKSDTQRSVLNKELKVDTSLHLSLIAILFSAISLIWSIHIGNRDRGKLRASSRIYKDASGNLFMEIKAVNCGRRPVILTMLRSHFADGTWSGVYLGNNNMLRLDEKESFKQTVRPGDNYTLFSDKGDVKETIDFSFEDTLGRVYRVKHARKHLRKIWAKSKK